MLCSRGWFFFTALCLLILCAALPLHAQSEATGQVKAVLDKAMDIQTRPELQGTGHRKERSVQIRKLIAENFMSAEMARESLPDHWDKLSGGQRQQYQELFSGLFQDSYTRMVLDFLKRETVEFPGESPEGKSVKVRTIIMRTNEHIPVDYILDRKGQRWLIRDVIIDGVSIVDNYKNTFGSFIRKQSFDALLQRMRIQKKAGEDT
ncbi:MAG: ABC transporter substrate-binding protein [Syntrophobacteraceae bacterium]